MARQGTFFHKCHRCIYRGQAADWEPEAPPIPMLHAHVAEEPARTGIKEVPLVRPAASKPAVKPAAGKPAAAKPAIKPAAAKAAIVKPAAKGKSKPKGAGKPAAAPVEATSIVG